MLGTEPTYISWAVPISFTILYFGGIYSMCSPLPLSHPFRTENNSVSTPRPETEISHSIEEAGTP